MGEDEELQEIRDDVLLEEIKEEIEDIEKNENNRLWNNFHWKEVKFLLSKLSKVEGERDKLRETINNIRRYLLSDIPESVYKKEPNDGQG